MSMTIIATDKRTGEKIEIDDLYWFEENFVHNIDDPNYDFEIYVEGLLMWSSE